MKPWDRQPGETLKAFQAFGEYLLLGPKRSIGKLAAKEGRRRTLEGWSSRNRWQDRVAAWDTEQLAKAMQDRSRLQERARQRLIDQVEKAVDTLFELLRGDLRALGTTTPILDRHGEEVGQAPLVKASTRLQAAKEILDRAGVMVPKRIELTGADGKELILNAQAAVSKLTDEQLKALTKVFGDGGDGG